MSKKFIHMMFITALCASVGQVNPAAAEFYKSSYKCLKEPEAVQPCLHTCTRYQYGTSTGKSDCRDSFVGFMGLETVVESILWCDCQK